MSSDRPEAAGIATLMARRAAPSAILSGAVFSAYLLSAVAQYATVGRTAQQRARLAATTGKNIGLEALLGVAHRIDTVAGYMDWRSVGILSVVGAVWALLVAIRLTRGEEDAGRWELLIAGGITRTGALWQTIAGLGAGLAALWGLTAVACVLIGQSPNARFSVAASLFLATALAGSAAVFLGVGLVCGQLVSTRRQAYQLAAAILGATYLVRMIADSAKSAGWLRWFSPFGWLEESHPLIGANSPPLVAMAALTVALGGCAVWIAGKRDVGAGLIPSRHTRPAHLHMLGSPLGLAFRLNRNLFAAWMAGIAFTAFIGGVVAKSNARATGGSTAMQHALSRLGATGASTGTVSYLAIFFVVSAALIAFAGVGQLASAHDEEAAGRIDHLIAESVGRIRWLTGRVAVAVALVLAASVVTGIAAWAGAATQHSGVGLGTLIEAGVNVAFPALLVVGAGVLIYGLAPRPAVAIVYALVAWSFILQLIGAGVPLNHWLLDTSVLTHITSAPAHNPNWVADLWLAALSLICLAAGITAFTRRDLTSLSGAVSRRAAWRRAR